MTARTIYYAAREDQSRARIRMKKAATRARRIAGLHPMRTDRPYMIYLAARIRYSEARAATIMALELVD